MYNVKKFMLCKKCLGNINSCECTVFRVGDAVKISEYALKQEQIEKDKNIPSKHCKYNYGLISVIKECSVINSFKISSIKHNNSFTLYDTQGDEFQYSDFFYPSYLFEKICGETQ